MFKSQTLSTQDFTTQATQTCAQLQSMDIQSYLALMLSQYHEDSEQCLFLPSLLSMAEYFECSAVEIHQALEQLKAFGCDFFIMGFESPITLWYPERLNGAVSQSA
jgi:hypothetical protein